MMNKAVIKLSQDDFIASRTINRADAFTAIWRWSLIRKMIHTLFNIPHDYKWTRSKCCSLTLPLCSGSKNIGTLELFFLLHVHQPYVQKSLSIILIKRHYNNPYSLWYITGCKALWAYFHLFIPGSGYDRKSQPSQSQVKAALKPD